MNPHGAGRSPMCRVAAHRGSLCHCPESAARTSGYAKPAHVRLLKFNDLWVHGGRSEAIRKRSLRSTGLLRHYVSRNDTSTTYENSDSGRIPDTHVDSGHPRVRISCGFLRISPTETGRSVRDHRRHDLRPLANDSSRLSLSLSLHNPDGGPERLSGSHQSGDEAATSPRTQDGTDALLRAGYVGAGEDCAGAGEALMARLN